MQKLKVTIKRKSHGSSGERSHFRLCKINLTRLETGEVIKRGCGRFGLMRFEAGWRCFYCGNYVYESGTSVEALWFHFRIAREYWRMKSRLGKWFINGVPVEGKPEPLTGALLADLAEPDPPKWFAYFLRYEADEFEKFLQRS